MSDVSVNEWTDSKQVNVIHSLRKVARVSSCERTKNWFLLKDNHSNNVIVVHASVVPLAPRLWATTSGGLSRACGTRAGCGTVPAPSQWQWSVYLARLLLVSLPMLITTLLKYSLLISSQCLIVQSTILVDYLTQIAKT